jgi:Tol biopolymer transport system component
VAVEVTDEGEIHVWIVNIVTGIGTQLTFEGRNQFPIWTSDSQTIVFRSDRNSASPYEIYRKAADGSGEAELLYQGENLLIPTDLLEDGVLVFQERASLGGADLKTLQLDGDGSVTEFLSTPADERSAQFSPDGKWISYVSDESDLNEIYVRPYPTTPGGKRRISSNTGTSPVWSPDGTELSYGLDTSPFPLMTVTIQTSPDFVIGRPLELFPTLNQFETTNEVRRAPMHDITPDGTRFVFVQTAVQAESEKQPVPQINVVLNWFEELKTRVPVP